MNRKATDKMARPKRDPLIAAMIAKLPEGEEWPVDRQLSWLHLMAMAFGTVYGGDAAARLGTHEPVKHLDPNYRDARPGDVNWLGSSVEKPTPKYPFYIDEEGVARRANGKQVKPDQVKGELFDLRGQEGDMKTIQWADGSTGLNGADLTIIAV